MHCDYCSAPINDDALACPACASKIANATAWIECLHEAIDTAERVGLTDDSTEAALVLVRGDGARLRYTLAECKSELSTLTESERPC